MSHLFNTFLYEPALNLLIFIYQNLAFQDLGVAIIMLTAVIRIVLHPLFYKGAKDQALLQKLQPKIKQIQEELKDKKEEQAKALLAVYRENKLNPFSGFLLLLVQLPIIIALYRVFLDGVSNAAFDNNTFLGLINLGQKDIFLVVVAAALQYYQGKLSLGKTKNEGKSEKNENPMASMGKTMVYVGPAITLIILMNLPSAVSLYWVVSTLFSIGQQLVINRKMNV